MSTRLAIALLGLAVTSIARADAPPPSATEPAPAEPAAVEPASSSPDVTPPAPALPLPTHPTVPNAAVQRRLPVERDPAPPRPRRHGDAGAPFALGIGAGLMWRNEPAHRVFTDRAHTPGLEVFARHDVWARSRTILAAGASLRSEQLGDDDRFAVHHHAVQAELAARYGVSSWLWPELRAGVGVVTSRFRMTEERADALDYRDRDTHVVGSVGAGVTLRTPTRLFETPRGRLASLSLGLLLDGGYTFAKDAKLSANPSSDGEVARSGFALGDLKRGGAYFRTMLVLRF
ncbi:MAG: hypothetical protein ABW252_10825 [Polyangiales bacterium]